MFDYLLLDIWKAIFAVLLDVAYLNDLYELKPVFSLTVSWFVCSVLIVMSLLLSSCLHPGFSAYLCLFPSPNVHPLFCTCFPWIACPLSRRPDCSGIGGLSRHLSSSCIGVPDWRLCWGSRLKSCLSLSWGMSCLFPSQPTPILVLDWSVPVQTLVWSTLLQSSVPPWLSSQHLFLVPSWWPCQHLYLAPAWLSSWHLIHVSPLVVRESSWFSVGQPADPVPLVLQQRPSQLQPLVLPRQFPRHLTLVSHQLPGSLQPLGPHRLPRQHLITLVPGSPAPVTSTCNP